MTILFAPAQLTRQSEFERCDRSAALVSHRGPSNPPGLVYVGKYGAKIHASRRSIVRYIDDRFSQLVGVPWALGVPVCHRLDRRSLSLARACLAAV
jgi:hypothetical protein